VPAVDAKTLSSIHAFTAGYRLKGRMLVGSFKTHQWSWTLPIGHWKQRLNRNMIAGRPAPGMSEWLPTRPCVMRGSERTNVQGAYGRRRSLSGRQLGDPAS
jgi:hypothetical protein